MHSKPYFPNLDGFRFLAFLAVFLFHSGYTEYDYIKNDHLYKFVKHSVFSYGHLGVNFFFVLSGFLITYLLLQEEVVNRRIDLGKFYMRRILRIWPLYYFSVVFGFVLFPLLKTLMGQLPQENADVWYFLIFLSNFNTIENGLPDASVLGVLWSVSIEEQFYFFWPLLFILFKKRKIFIFTGVIVLSLIFRFANQDNGDILYYHTLSSISDMAIGGLVSWTLFSSGKTKFLLINLKKKYIISVYIFGLFIIISPFWTNDYALFLVFERVIMSFFFAFIIAEQCFSKNSFYKMSNYRYITKWGKYTYGLYCLHFIGILITTNLFKFLKMNDSVWFVLIVETLIALLLSMIISWISYHFFESWFLRSKTRFDYLKKNPA